MHPDADPLGAGYHMTQSLIAVGTGGVLGADIWRECRNSFIFPKSHTDYIFANIAEELGFIGALIVVRCLSSWLIAVCGRSLLCHDPFARLLAFGITTTILLQAFFNISVVLALVPTKGITLPLISYGGTSLFITLLSIGVLLNITRECD